MHQRVSSYLSLSFLFGRRKSCSVTDHRRDGGGRLRESSRICLFAKPGRRSDLYSSLCNPATLIETHDSRIRESQRQKQRATSCCSFLWSRFLALRGGKQQKLKSLVNFSRNCASLSRYDECVCLLLQGACVCRHPFR